MGFNLRLIAEQQLRLIAEQQFEASAAEQQHCKPSRKPIEDHNLVFETNLLR